MDSWPYMENPVPPLENHSKARLHPGDDLAALTMLYEQCKVDNAESVATRNQTNLKVGSYFSDFGQFFFFFTISFFFFQNQKEQKITACNRTGNKTDRWDT